MFIRTILISLALMFTTPAMAQTAFQNLDDSDFEDIIQDLSGLLTHTSVSGADGLGDIFGVEVGLIVGAAETPGIERLSKEVSSSADVSQIPHGGIYAAVTFPYGITGELNFLPEVEAEDADLTNVSLAVKWTFSDLMEWPVDVAVKASNTTNEFSFVQDQPAPNTKVAYESTIQAVSFVVSKNFILFEPFVGFGFMNADGEIKATNAIFTSSAVSGSDKISGSQFFAGANLNLVFFKLGLEVGKVFDNTKASLKTSFYF